MTESGVTDDLVKIAVFIFALILVFPLLMMVFAAVFMGSNGWMGGAMIGDVHPAWGFGSVLLGVLLVLGFVYFMRELFFGTKSEEESVDPALEELRIAYARGELTDEEYERRRTKLENDS